MLPACASVNCRYESKTCSRPLKRFPSIQLMEHDMPEQEVLDRVKRDQEEGKSPSTQAGEFVREEMRHIRQGKHGAASTKQAIAIGLSKARRAGVDLPQPSERTTSERTRKL